MAITFVVVSGKYDYNDDGSYERNTKYISEPFTDYYRALQEWEFSHGYAFNEILMYVDDNFVATVNPNQEN